MASDKGLQVEDKEGQTRKILKAFASQFGSSLFFSGKQLWKFSLPSEIHKPYSGLDLQGNDFSFLDLLEEAAYATVPLDRIKLVTTFYFASLHRSLALLEGKVMFNPILGETLQRESVDGKYKFYAE